MREPGDPRRRVGRATPGRAAISVALLWLGSCGQDSPTPAAEPSFAPAASPACRALADRARDAFRRPDGPRLFRRVDRAPYAGRGHMLDSRLPRIVIDEDRLRIDGVELSGDTAPATVASELAMRAELASAEGHAGHGGGWADAVVLYAGGEVRVARLARAIAPMADSLRLELVVQVAPSGPPAEPEPPAWLSGELERLRQEPSLDARRARFRELFIRAVGQCAPARAHAAFLFGRDPEVPAAAEPSGSLPEALMRCDCEGVDDAVVVALGILAGPVNRYPLRTLSFRRVEAPSDRTITAVPSDTIASFVEQLAHHADPLRVYFPAAPPAAETVDD